MAQPEDNISHSGALLLGALNGSVYCIAIYLVIEVQSRLAFQRELQEASSLGIPPGLVADAHPQWAVVLPCTALLFSATSYLARRFWDYPRDSIRLWQGVGVASIATWNLILLTLFWVEKGYTGRSLGYDVASSYTNPLFGPLSLILIVITNLIFASLLKLLTKGRSIHWHAAEG